MIAAVAASVETEVAAIQAFGGVVTALVIAASTVMVAMLNSTRKHAKAGADAARATRDQVVNSHSTNLRDELDERHAETIAGFARIDRVHTSMKRSITRIEDHLGLEHTQPPPARRRTR